MKYNTKLWVCTISRKAKKKAHLSEDRKKKKLYWHFLFFFVKWKHCQRRFWSDYTVLFSRSFFFFFFFQEDDDFQWQKEKKIPTGEKGGWGMDACLTLSSLSNLFFFFPSQREPGRRQTNRLYRQSILFLSFRDLPITTEITKQKTIPGSFFFL